MTALLTDNLPLLAGAPNGIKKLRELILELAVRGKLLPQDPNDEPASELLKRIAEEKARLVAEGKIRKQKPLAEIAEEKFPFELPSGWEWSQLGQISSDVQYGFTASANHQNEEPLLLRITDIQNDGVNWDTVPGCDISPAEIAGYELKDGDIVIARTGGTIGKSYLLSGLTRSAVFASYLIRIGRLDSIYPGFTKIFLGSQFYWKQLYANSMGTGQPNVNGTALKGLLIPLAPMEEQHRIVAKVDELMALCDRLEAQQADAESAHAQLVQALLDSLTQASDVTDFAANWQRLAEHFHTLLTTESSIDALKQTLLQLAVMGKLVPQDPSDEPASELLKRIAEERMRLANEGKLKKQKLLTVVSKEENPFIAPNGWEWVKFDHVAANENNALKAGPFGSALKKEMYVAAGYKIYGQEQVISGDENIGDYYISHEKYNSLGSCAVKPGDILISLVGTIGRVLVLSEDCKPGIINPRLVKVSLYSDVNRDFVSRVLASPLLRKELAEKSHGGTMDILNLGLLRSVAIPLPPFAEQHRIVTKVDQLMAFCDQLKNRLTQARQLNEQLASTLIERALVEDRQPVPAATDRKLARSLLAAEITHQLHSQRTFGQRKLQKVIHLAEHAAKLAAIQGNYLRDAAGPHDRQLMDQVEGELHNRQWYERIERDTVGHAYRPLADAGQHRQAYESAWSAAERATVQQVIDLMRGWDTDRCERVVTLYAAWNDLLLEGKAVTDAMLVHEVMYSWNDTKLRYTEAQWLNELDEMKKQKLFTPTGFGKRTHGGMQTLPGLH